MIRMKRIVLVAVALMLVMPAMLVIAADVKETNVPAEQDGAVSSKDEVVYATLSATGDEKNIYVVNMLDITKAGEIIDYGAYASLKNMTDLSELEQADEKIKVTTTKGKFYYQGNMKNASLPWNFSIAYFLNGKKVPPENLVGQKGRVKIAIETSANETVDATFFDNYLLQISLTFDAETTNHIKAEDGMIANAGKNKQVTFTVMPEQEEKLVVEADVEDFELEAIEIAGVPSTVSIDPPDVDEMTGEMKTLASAISDINEGVGTLKTGAADLHNGAKTLQSGSTNYKEGMNQLDGSSSELIQGSEEIDGALELMSSSLSGLENIDVSELENLGAGLSELSKGLKETTAELSKLQKDYSSAYHALDQAMGGIPDNTISKEEIQALKESGADQHTINQLVKTYEKAQSAKKTYNEGKQNFEAVDQALIAALASAEQIDIIVQELDFSSVDVDVAGEFTELTEGISSLSTSYKKFHAGLLQYTNGVNELSNSYSDIHGGITALSAGTGELEAGVGELHKGTTKLNRSTSDLPEQMTKEIDEMIAEFDKSDFDVVSFVSEENKNVYSVQFVLKTEGIQKTDAITDEEREEEPKGFWAKLKALFS